MFGPRAIETKYKGYRFRSRLEARWAVFFDTLGVKWEYEKEGFDLGKVGKYLPDFWLPEFNCWIEVKGEKPTAEEVIKLMFLIYSQANKQKVYAAILGGIPDANKVADTCEGLGLPYREIKHTALALAKGNHERMNKAYHAARAARWEHGETPVVQSTVPNEANDAATYFCRGSAYEKKGELDLAIQDYTQALNLNPKLAVAYFCRGSAYEKKGELDLAIQDYTQALNLNPKFALASNKRGDAYKQKAIADYRQALELTEDPAKRQELEQQLKDLGAQP